MNGMGYAELVVIARCMMTDRRWMIVTLKEKKMIPPSREIL